MFITSSPRERKSAGFRWTEFLNGGAITSWDFEPLHEELQEIATSFDDEDNKTMIMWTGGVPGTQYTITGWISVDDGRKEYESFTVLVIPN